MPTFNANWEPTLSPVQPGVQPSQETVEKFFEAAFAGPSAVDRTVDYLKTDLQFRNYLLDSLREGVIFVDAQRRVTCWNQSAEVMTGMSASKMHRMELAPGILNLASLDGKIIDDANCPIKAVIHSCEPAFHEFNIRGRSGREVKVEFSIIPVMDQKIALGAIILVHDTSAQVELERQLKDLHTLIVRDPLTQVANRAEFERVLDEYVRMHQATGNKCSIIICDIDFFKQVNDNYGHHIGDQALIAFARVLQKHVRNQDIVARYGGEEFVILCANCDIEVACQRAEEIRTALNKTPQQMLNGKTITASFGVSELQENESVTDFFVRADQALYEAKNSGRNRVIRAGKIVEDSMVNDSKNHAIEINPKTGTSRRQPNSKLLYDREFVSSGSRTMLIEKLSGYVNEKRAKIRKSEQNYISMIVRVVDAFKTSRQQDFRVDIELQDSNHGVTPQTNIRVAIFAPQRKLFRGNLDDLHHLLVMDIRRYLMINDEASCMTLNPVAELPSVR